MKTILAGLVALTSAAFAQLPNAPEPPSLKEVLKRPNPHVIIFRPTSLAPGQSLNVTHIRMGDGSVKFVKSGVQLVVYSSEPNLDGEHEVLFQDFHFLTTEGSPVRNFAPYDAPTDPVSERGRTGIIAILIGLSQPSPNGPVRPVALPPNDIVSAEITDGTSNTAMLLPAVQKVRSAAAR